MRLRPECQKLQDILQENRSYAWVEEDYVDGLLRKDRVLVYLRDENLDRALFELNPKTVENDPQWAAQYVLSTFERQCKARRAVYES